MPENDDALKKGTTAGNTARATAPPTLLDLLRGGHTFWWARIKGTPRNAFGVAIANSGVQQFVIVAKDADQGRLVAEKWVGTLGPNAKLLSVSPFIVADPSILLPVTPKPESGAEPVKGETGE